MGSGVSVKLMGDPSSVLTVKGTDLRQVAQEKAGKWYDLRCFFSTIMQFS